jgi:hypothetical protein
MLHLKLLLIIGHLLGNYACFPISPWWLALRLNKWSPLGMGLILGGPIPDHTYHFSHFILSFAYLLGFSGVLTQEGIVPHFMGRKG